MIPRSNFTGHALQKVQHFFQRHRIALGSPLAPRVPCRSFWVVQSEGHVFARFTPREREDWKLPAEIHFGPGAEYRDEDANLRRHGRMRNQEEPWVETRSIDVGEVDTPEKAALLHCMIKIVEQSDYDGTNVDAFSCIGATDALVSTLRQKPPLAPVGTNTLDSASDYMTKLAEGGDSPAADELTFHIHRSQPR